MAVRYIKVNNIEIGYDYPKKQYYVTNADTTTYRDTVETIQDVLQALEVTSVTDEQLQGLKNNYETILDTDNTILYTWEETGLYIKSLQFNRWKDYKLIIDCPKAKLYIENSTTIFDLNAKESTRVIIAPILCSFYKETLGIDIDITTMTGLCNFLLYFYHPTCVNLIGTLQGDETNTLRYTDTYKLTNYDKSSPATYTCTNNPLNEGTLYNVGSIIATTDSSIISLLEPLDATITNRYGIEEGTSIYIQGITEESEGTTYTNDGVYTIQDISEDRKELTVVETFPVTYNYDFYNCYIVGAKYTITSMDRESNTITVSASPDSILLEDKVIVSGASITTSYENISLDGEYTVQSIESIEGSTEYNIVVEEQIPTNFSGTATLYRPIYVSPVKAKRSIGVITRLTFLNPTDKEFTLNITKVLCYNSNIQNVKEYTVTDVKKEGENTVSIVIVTDSAVDIPSIVYPQVQFLVPSPRTMVEVEETSDKKILPTGEFIVNSYTEVNNYLGLLKERFAGFKVPSDMLEDNPTKNLYTRDIEELMYSKVEDSITFHVVWQVLDYTVTIYRNK